MPPPRDELVIKVLVALQVPGIDVHEILQVHRRHVIEIMQRYTRVKAAAAEDDTALALVADAELFRLEAIVRWLDVADVRLKQRPTPAAAQWPKSLRTKHLDGGPAMMLAYAAATPRYSVGLVGFLVAGGPNEPERASRIGAWASSTIPSPARGTGTSSGRLANRRPVVSASGVRAATISQAASRVASYTNISVRSRSAARNAAFSVRSSRRVVSRAAAGGWSTTRTSMADPVEPNSRRGHPIACSPTPTPSAPSAPPIRRTQPISPLCGGLVVDAGCRCELDARAVGTRFLAALADATDGGAPAR